MLECHIVDISGQCVARCGGIPWPRNAFIVELEFTVLVLSLTIGWNVPKTPLVSWYLPFTGLNTWHVSETMVIVVEGQLGADMMLVGLCPCSQFRRTRLSPLCCLPQYQCIGWLRPDNIFQHWLPWCTECCQQCEPSEKMATFIPSGVQVSPPPTHTHTPDVR